MRNNTDNSHKESLQEKFNRIAGDLESKLEEVPRSDALPFGGITVAAYLTTENLGERDIRDLRDLTASWLDIFQKKDNGEEFHREDLESALEMHDIYLVVTDDLRIHRTPTVPRDGPEKLEDWDDVDAIFAKQPKTGEIDMDDQDSFSIFKMSQFLATICWRKRTRSIPAEIRSWAAVARKQQSGQHREKWQIKMVTQFYSGPDLSRPAEDDIKALVNTWHEYNFMSEWDDEAEERGEDPHVFVQALRDHFVNNWGFSVTENDEYDLEADLGKIVLHPDNEHLQALQDIFLDDEGNRLEARLDDESFTCIRTAEDCAVLTYHFDQRKRASPEEHPAPGDWATLRNTTVVWRESSGKAEPKKDAEHKKEMRDWKIRMTTHHVPIAPPRQL